MANTDLDMDINWIFYLRITMIDEMLLFNRHDEINLDALKIIKEKRWTRWIKFMTKYLTGIVFINSIWLEFKNFRWYGYKCWILRMWSSSGWQCQLDTIKWGSLTKDEEKIQDAKEIERMYSDLVSFLSQHFKITIVKHFQLPDIECFSKFFFW